MCRGVWHATFRRPTPMSIIQIVFGLFVMMSLSLNIHATKYLLRPSKFILRPNCSRHNLTLPLKSSAKRLLALLANTKIHWNLVLLIVPMQANRWFQYHKWHEDVPQKNKLRNIQRLPKLESDVNKHQKCTQKNPKIAITTNESSIRLTSNSHHRIQLRFAILCEFYRLLSPDTVSGLVAWRFGQSWMFT